MVNSIDIVGILDAITWPLVVLVILLAFRRYLPDLAKGLAARVTKLEFAGIAIELVEAKSFTPDWSGAPVPLDLQHQLDRKSLQLA